MRIIVALDKFKGTLSAAEACRVVASALSEGLPGVDVVELPMSDGGEGYASVMGRYAGLKKWSMDACNALGQPIGQVDYYVGGGVAVADCASVLSLSLIAADRRRVVAASTEPLGRFLRDIAGVHGPGLRLKLGVGGTSTTDGGAGVVRGLGGVFGDISPEEMLLPADLLRVSGRPDVGNLKGMFESVELMCDVDVPLLAPEGEPSAMTFASQKGLADGDYDLLCRALGRWRSLVDKDGDARPGDGAGGGIPFGLTRLLPSVSTSSGAESVIEASGLFKSGRPDLVIVGEGSLDNQSMLGKIAGRIASEARRRGIAVGAVAGRVDRSFATAEPLAFVIDSSQFTPDGVTITPEIAADNLRRAVAAKLSAVKLVLGVKPC